VAWVEALHCDVLNKNIEVIELALLEFWRLWQVL
jgi:hypothetical protein